MVHVFKNIGEWSTAKNYCALSLHSVVSKLFGKLANNRIVDHLEKYVLFCDLQCVFSAPQSTVDLMMVVSDRIARAFDKSEASPLIYPRLLAGFGMLFSFTNLRLMEFQVRY